MANQVEGKPDEMIVLGPQVSELEARDLYQDLVDKKLMSLDQANLELSSQNAKPLEEHSSPRPEMDQALEAFSPATRPEEYQLPQFHDSWENPSEMHHRMDRDVRTMLLDAKFDPSTGKSLIEQMRTNSRRIEGLSEEQFRILVQNERDKLLNLWGESQAQSKFNRIKDFIFHLEGKRTGMAQFLLDNDALFSNATTVAMLDGHIERLQMRHGTYKV